MHVPLTSICLKPTIQSHFHFVGVYPNLYGYQTHLTYTQQAEKAPARFHLVLNYQ
jgi:hypothetical protein